MPSGNKPLPEPMLTQFSVAIWRQYATMSQAIHANNNLFVSKCNHNWHKTEQESLWKCCAWNENILAETKLIN